MVEWTGKDMTVSVANGALFIRVKGVANQYIPIAAMRKLVVGTELDIEVQYRAKEMYRFDGIEKQCRIHQLEAKNTELLAEAREARGLLARSEGVQLVLNELRSATSKSGPFNSGHEGYAVIREELDELWEEIKSKEPGNDARQGGEAIQVAAMALRYLHDICGVEVADG